MKKLLLTGANGFLGKSIMPILKTLYTIITLDINHCDYNCDLSKEEFFVKEKMDIVLHAAGKAHVIPKSEKDAEEFYAVNYCGTVNLCKGLEQSVLPQNFIFISTVAVYGCEFGEDITEEHPLNGDTPYALSKIKAEQYLARWCKQHNVILSILRPSLLAGPDPPGNLGAMINGIKTGRYLSVAGGKARKSVLMAHDIANLVPLLLGKGGVYNVCSDEQPTFRQLETLIARQLGRNTPLSIPYWLAKTLALCGDLLGEKSPINSNKLSKITKSLTFSNRKAKETLNWQPVNVLENLRI